MRPFATNVVAPLLPAALAMWSPGAAVAQATSAHPASVSLTVVVPARASSVALMVNGETLRVVRRGPHAIDIETSIGIIDRPATRVEVSLGRARSANAPPVRVWNSRGRAEECQAPARGADTADRIAGERAERGRRVRRTGGRDSALHLRSRDVEAAVAQRRCRVREVTRRA